MGRLLDASSRAVYAIDERRQIVYCNTACGELLGLDPEQLIGQRCDYQVVRTGSTPADIASSLCPPPEAFAGRVTASVVSALHVSGELLARQAEFVSLSGDELHSLGVVVTLSASAGDMTFAQAAASEAAALHQRLARLRRQYLAAGLLDELVGVSPAIQRVRDQVALASRGKTRVLIQGPAGSGREHVARLLHRRAVPDLAESLVPLWCPLLDAELIQSTVTALVRQFMAPCASACGCPPVRVALPMNGRATCARLPRTDLAVAGSGSVTPRRASRAGRFPDAARFRAVTPSATSQDPLFRLAEQERFRVDLAHSLSTLVIDMPPLAARPQDIPLLCQCLVERFNAKGDRQLSGFTSEAIDELTVYPWPENVDELAEVVDLACQAADGPFVEARQLPDKIRWAHQAVAHPRREEQPIVLGQFLEDIEKELIVRAMKRAKGNKTKAARLLGVTRARFHRRLEHFGRST